MNLAARLQTLAEPDAIVVSAETFALVRDIVAAHPLPAVTVRGFALRSSGSSSIRSSICPDGLEFYLDVKRIENGDSGRLRAILGEALAALEQRAEP